MEPEPKQIRASDFKARCLALLDEVDRTGVPYIVTKRGRPVARLVPLERPSPPDLRGSVRWASEEDLLGPVDEPWEADG